MNPQKSKAAMHFDAFMEEWGRSYLECVADGENHLTEKQFEAVLADFVEAASNGYLETLFFDFLNEKTVEYFEPHLPSQLAPE